MWRSGGREHRQVAQRAGKRVQKAFTTRALLRPQRDGTSCWTTGRVPARTCGVTVDVENAGAIPRNRRSEIKSYELATTGGVCGNR